MDILQILFFAGLAVFLGIRLYMVLGRPTGRSPEEHAAEQAARDAARQPATLSDAPAPQPASRPVYGGPAGAGLAAIAEADARFDPETFREGAESAYRMIVAAYASGDRETLRPLLSQRVFDRYDAAISERERNGEQQVTEIERVRTFDIEAASLDGTRAKIKMRVEAELATETRNADGERVSGDLNTLRPVEELWSFERDVTSPDPNWTLFAVKPL